MGFGKLAFFVILSVFFKPMICLQSNTDGSFVHNFLNNMGLNVSGFPFSVCSWKGVYCDDKRVNVIKLDASGLGLSGVIPENTIGKLIMLENLDLSNNQITSLPSDFWSLGLLKNLNLSFNKLAGTFSGNVGNFGALENLDISFNNFTGSIPDALSSLRKLKVLNLSHNGFESAIPSGILHYNDLVSIDLSENKLSGSLPKGFIGAFEKLKFLNLAGNQITGGESSFSGMNFLSYLNISSNLFKGSVVGIFKGLLQVIDLSGNQFQGHIAQVNISSSFNWSNLMYLDLSDNQFSGEFLTELTHAQNLKHLNLANNRFTKQKFLQVSMLAKLEYLNFSGTNLIGEIPGNISLLHSLRVLDLSKNHLSNHIPLVISNNLQILDISQNNLTGPIPLLILQELHKMKSYNFSYNNLSFCASPMSPDILQSSFIGSVNSCPIAVNPIPFKRKPESHHWGLKLALVLTLSMFCLLVGLLFLAFRCRRKTGIWVVKHDSVNEEQIISGPFSFQTDSTTWVADVRQPISVPVIIFEKPLLNYTFADLLSSTSNFDRGTLLAEGRFGPVYGGLLPGGIHVAVKVLVNGSTMTDEEAARELEYLGRIRHPNLVPLTGYCLAGNQRIAIYEYMENGNLQNFLYDLPLGIQRTEDWSFDTWEDESTNGIQNVGSEGSLVNWSIRKKIALGTARALAFLHHGCSPPIIHRDVKASSVYLDSNLEPRLSDFGLAKISGNGLEKEITNGLPGYVPPEFLQSESGGSSPKAAPTPKSDVYGFGVILFELISGKRPVEDDYPEEKDANLVSWVRGLVRRNQGIRAIDPKIRGTGPDAQIIEALKIGYLCTAEIPSKRPSLQQVVGLLKDLEPNAV